MNAGSYVSIMSLEQGPGDSAAVANHVNDV